MRWHVGTVALAWLAVLAGIVAARHYNTRPRPGRPRPVMTIQPTQAEADAASRYPVGTPLRFADANATRSDGATVLAAGVVNGAPIQHPTLGVIYVPVFTSRDNGREPTTVYVSEANIVEPDAAPTRES